MVIYDYPMNGYFLVIFMIFNINVRGFKIQLIFFKWFLKLVDDVKSLCLKEFLNK